MRISLLAAGVIIAGGCVAGSDHAAGADKVDGTGTAPAVHPEEGFQLKIGESHRIAAENVDVEFLSVASDSRCGKGEVCIWEGDATVVVRLRIADRVSDELELHTAAKEPRHAQFAGYSIQLLALSPAPIAGRAIAPGDYLATLRLTRGAAPDSDYQ